MPAIVVDRILSLTLFVLALACLCGAALLTLTGFIDWLIYERWPDQSVWRLASDSGLLQRRWFLTRDWLGPVRDVLTGLPAPAVAIALTPLCWWLSNVFARR